jgi:hypothetical protein
MQVPLVDSQRGAIQTQVPPLINTEMSLEPQEVPLVTKKAQKLIVITTTFTLMALLLPVLVVLNAHLV